LAQARAELQDAAHAVNRGRTVIGAMPLARSWLVPSAVLRFLETTPGHTVEILDGPYDTLLEALRRGEADVLVGALRHPAPVDVLQEHLFDDPLAIVMRAGHPLATVANRKRPATAAQLARYAWVAPRTGSPLRAQYTALFQAAGLPVPIGAVECNSWVAARSLLLASDRLMLLSARQVHQELEAGLLAVLPHPAGEVTRDIGLTLRRGWRPTASQDSLLEELRLSPRLR
jgi:DNA-binding transcriptional LysR family regulator